MLEKRYRTKIIQTGAASENSIFLDMELPSGYSWHPGQYLQLYIPEKPEGTSFSMVSLATDGYIRLGIKMNGRNEYWQDLSCGDEVEISEPKGRFILNTKPSEFRTLLFFAAGIGITPIIPQIRNVLNTEPRTRIYLFYGNSGPETVAFRPELEALMDQYGDRTEVHYFYSKNPVLGPLFTGRLDDKKFKLIVNQILHLDDTDEESTIFDATDFVMVCGPGEMVKNIAGVAYQEGIPKENILFELFEPYEGDIFPQIIEYPPVENIRFTFRYKGLEQELFLPKNEHSLLNEILESKLSAPYSCKSGVCGLCMCKIISGRVASKEDEYLTDSEKEKGYILACCSYPITQEIEVNFDQ